VENGLLAFDHIHRKLTLPDQLRFGPHNLRHIHRERAIDRTALFRCISLIRNARREAALPALDSGEFTYDNLHYQDRRVITFLILHGFVPRSPCTHAKPKIACGEKNLPSGLWAVPDYPERPAGNWTRVMRSFTPLARCQSGVAQEDRETP